ncbi:MAG: hypothetical protein M4579_003398 [Chaenotheca gracillima]|nr:MAG: hypothetical protein M4579_003398 [Chaenotheca gracillima]
MDSGDDNANKAPGLLVTIWTLAALSTIILGLRFYVRACIVHRVGWDDYWMLLAWVGNTLFASFLTVSCHYGLGRHFYTLSEDRQINAMHWDFVGQAWGVFTPMFARISFSFTLLNLVGSTSKLKRQLIWFFIIAQLAAGVSTVILIYVQCGSHVEALWDHRVKASCWSPNVQTYYGFFQSTVNSVTDLFLTLLPAWIVSQTQMRKTLKLLVAGLLGMSLFAMVASIVKTYELKNLGARNDFTWNTPIFFIWTVVELNVVIMAASIPTLKALFPTKAASSAAGRYEMHPSGLTKSAYARQKERQSWSFKKESEASSYRHDASSEEHILPIQPADGIKKTTQVTVTYSGEPQNTTSQQENSSAARDPAPFTHPEDRV